MSRSRRPWLMPVSLLIALLLGLVPLPVVLQPFRPYWLALVMAYWVLEDHERIGMGSAFLLGIAADLCFGSLLGEQALRLSVMAFILHRFRARMRFYPVPQQAAAIGGLLLNDRIVAAALDLAFGAPMAAWQWWLAPLIGALLWPPLFVLLDTLRLGRRN